MGYIFRYANFIRGATVMKATVIKLVIPMRNYNAYAVKIKFI